MQTEIIERIIHLPIAERVEIIEQISRSVKEDLRESDTKEKELSIEERKAIVERLAGSLKMENPPMTKKEVRNLITEAKAEKYK